jgi:hypothetical protein
MSSLAIRRVCIIRQHPYPQDLLVRREAEALRDEGFQVDVICLRLPAAQAEEAVEGVRVHRLAVTQKREVRSSMCSSTFCFSCWLRTS